MGLLLYLMIDNRKRLDAKEVEINNLNKEFREMQERFFDRLATLKRDGETVLMAIKDAIK